ncbi:hypothetical protein BHE74_00024138 [Ensete ventricosum]|nr:hypothetical protein BHE74_00024138 [Ensete ventricosum]
MVCIITASAWTWLVRSRKAYVVTMNGAGFDAGEGNPESVIILQKRLGVGMAAATSSVGRGWCKSFYESLVVDNRVDRDEDVKHGFYMIALGVLMHRLLVGFLKVLKLPSCP